MRSLIVLASIAAIAIASPTPAQEPQARQQGLTAAERADAEASGAAAGASKSTVGAGVAAATTSIVAPGGGFLYLLFLGSGEVRPNFSEQAFLRDKSADFTRVWVDSYDRALTRKQKKTIIIASAIPTALWVVLLTR